MTRGMTASTKPERRKWLALALIYGTLPFAVVGILWLRSIELVSRTSLWKFGLVLAISGAANAGTALWLARSPRASSRMHMRIAAGALGTAIVIYSVGWGSMLVIAYALGSAEVLRSVGPRMLAAMLGWNYAAILVGELAVAFGWAPSVLEPGMSHAVAVVGAVCLTIVTVILVDNARTAEEATRNLQERQRYFEALVANARDVIADLSPDGLVRHVSPAMSGLLGYSASEAVGEWIGDHLHPAEAELVGGALGEVIADKGNPHSWEVRVRHRNGSYRNVVATLTGAELEGEDMVIANLHDVTTERRLRRQLVHDARHDVLTGLLNRRAFNAVAARESRNADESGHALAVMYIDLDGFKAINDSFGHDMGDTVLVETARRLRLCIRSGDVLARLGGDEFAILVTLTDGPHPPVEVADRILRELAEPVPGIPFDVRMGASIGIAVRSDEGIELSSLMRDADSAMYEAKAGGRATWRLAASR